MTAPSLAAAPLLALAIVTIACNPTPASTDTGAATSTDAEATSGDGEPGDGEPGDGEPGDGEPGDGEPGDGEPGDGDPGPAACAPEPFPPAAVEDDGYRRFELCGFDVYMRDELFTDPLGADVYDALAEDLIMVIGLLPEPTVDFLRATNFWMELDEPDFPGGVYHPSAQWLSDNGYPSKWAQGIQFGNANNYMTWVEQQPAMVLHELSHAWDHQRHGFAHPDVLAAYDAAMSAGLYDAVEYVDGQILEAYAKNNAAEYFAELSEAYYWTNDFYPFVRAELARHDPVGLAAIEAAWSG